MIERTLDKPPPGWGRRTAGSPFAFGVFAFALTFGATLIAVVLQYAASRRACESLMASELTTLARTAASLVDADAHRVLTDPALQETPAYTAAVEPLRRMLVALRPLRHLCTVRRDGDSICFVLDATPPTDADGDGQPDAARLMTICPDTDAALARCLASGEAGISKLSRKDAWGAYCTAYAPIRDGSGAVVGAARVEVVADAYLQQLKDLRTSAVAGLIPGFLAGLAVGAATARLRRRALHWRDHREQVQAIIRERERMYEQVTDRCAAVLWLIDLRQRRALYISPAYEQVWGQSCEAHLRNPDDWINAVHPDDRTRVERAWRECAPGSRFECEYRILRPDGTVRWIHDRGTPVYDGDVLTDRIAGVAEDITDYKNAQLALELQKALLETYVSELRAANEDIRTSHERAESASRAKTEFLANVSHELKTPMTAILGYLEVLRDRVSADDAASGSTLAALQQNAERLLGIINDLLDLADLECGRLTISPNPCDVRLIVRTVCDPYRRRAARKDVHLELTDSDVPERVMIDPVRFRQVLINLVDNACKFTLKGRIDVRLRYDDHGSSGTLRLEVEDTGIGIAPEHVSRLFDPFFLVDGSASRAFQGSGLGLPICRSLAEKMGGTILVDSAPGSGSRFHVTIATARCPHTPAPHEVPQVAFPSRRDDDCNLTQSGSDGAKPPAAGSLYVGSPAKRRRRVLIVDDGPDNQRLLSYFLTRDGWDVSLADHGEKALHEIRGAEAHGEPYDLVLMDMQMPVMDGYTATREARRSGYAGPILAVTAHAAAGDEEKCLAAGCDAYLSKPLRRAALLELARRLTEPLPAGR
ncbi:MAG: ATP-binding protein [Phycisphaerae bacterium]|nr:MAG: response regulator [Phycisphaerae bacterium]MCK6466330.1 ATP-binding protein [Phycisphaerae bacterium]NUQ10587.1 response regulator [Phycisphaerae bacterium]